MNKNDFLKELEAGLAKASPDERVAAMQYYTEYLDEAGPEREEEVLEELGSPKQLAKDILATSGEAGEAFTPPERSGQDSAAKAEAAKPKKGADDSPFTIETPSAAESPFAGEAPHAPDPGPIDGENLITTLPQTTPPPQPPPQGKPQYNSQNNTVAKVLLAILLIIFLLPIGGGLFGVLVGVLVSVIVVFFIPIILGVVFPLAGIVEIVVGCIIMGSSVGSGIVCLGAGLLLIGLGLLCFYSGIKLLGKVLPAIVRGIASGMRGIGRWIGRLFNGGKVNG